jgi:AAA15 family ATPase/GTPase
LITQIKIEGFKSLANVDLTLGPFNLFVGANTSGKSNFFDALRVLRGIGYGFTMKLPSQTQEINYFIRFLAQTGGLRQEKLSLGNRMIFDAHAIENRIEDNFFNVKYFREGTDPQRSLKFEKSGSVLP